MRAEARQLWLQVLSQDLLLTGLCLVLLPPIVHRERDQASLSWWQFIPRVIGNTRDPSSISGDYYAFTVIITVIHLCTQWNCGRDFTEQLFVGRQFSVDLLHFCMSYKHRHQMLLFSTVFSRMFAERTAFEDTVSPSRESANLITAQYGRDDVPLQDWDQASLLSLS